MSEYQPRREPPREPLGMKIVGTGVIVACMVLATLFGWGVYLNLTRAPCPCECEVTTDAGAELASPAGVRVSRESMGPS